MLKFKLQKIFFKGLINSLKVPLLIQRRLIIGTVLLSLMTSCTLIPLIIYGFSVERLLLIVLMGSLYVISIFSVEFNNFLLEKLKKILKDEYKVLNIKKFNDKKLIFSDKFRNILLSINCKISSELLKHKGVSEITFFNYSDNKIIYNLYNKIDTKELKNTKHIEEVKNQIKKSRISTKPGRVINKLFPNKFTTKEIEIFVNKLKSSLSNGEEIVILKGRAINEAYTSSKCSDSGQISKSCMKNKHNLLAVYRNKKNCRVLALKSTSGTILSRAVIWEVDDNKHGIKYFMDRVYSNNDGNTEKMFNYAKSQGWAYRTTSVSGMLYKDKHVQNILTITIENPSVLPYLDTFSRFEVIEDKVRLYSPYVIDCRYYKLAHSTLGTKL